jgi:hypothetical protein
VAAQTTRSMSWRMIFSTAVASATLFAARAFRRWLQRRWRSAAGLVLMTQSRMPLLVTRVKTRRPAVHRILGGAENAPNFALEAVAVGNQDGRSVPMPATVLLGSLNEALDLSFGEIFSAASANCFMSVIICSYSSH